MTVNRKRIVIFETEGGKDKWIDGHRKDNVAIRNAINEKGMTCEIVFYRDEWNNELIKYVLKNFDTYISRINPGKLPQGEEKYFSFLNTLIENGINGFSYPKEMLNFGAKSILYKLRKTELVPTDIHIYKNISSLKENLKNTLKLGARVIKQNRGSTGNGVWKIEIIGRKKDIPLVQDFENIKIRCTEAFDNRSKIYLYPNFIKFCTKYFKSKNDLLIDMPFFPRITEGELRIIIVGEKPLYVVKKVPKKEGNSFSATLFSGAEYSYLNTEEWSELIYIFKKYLSIVKRKIGKKGLPLLWTADFILGEKTNGKDSYILSEINCSCVGFINKLNSGIQENIVEELLNRLSNPLTNS